MSSYSYGEDSDIVWVRATALGGPYEQEVSECGRFWRHRPLSIGRMQSIAGDFNASYPELEWRKGPEPKAGASS